MLSIKTIRKAYDSVRGLKTNEELREGIRIAESICHYRENCVKDALAIGDEKRVIALAQSIESNLFCIKILARRLSRKMDKLQHSSAKSYIDRILNA